MSSSTSPEGLVKILTENSLAATLVGALLIGATGACWKAIVRRAHEKRIVNFLKSSASDGLYTHRTTEAIASAAKLTQSRVEDICSTHKFIKRNTAQKQSWRLLDE